MKKYKVLRLVNGELISPYQNYSYGKLEDVLGKEMVCENFDINKMKECGRRFYATDIDGLIYTLNTYKDCRVFEVEMGGRSVIYNTYKQGFEKQTIIRMLPKSEVRELIREQSDKMDWDYYRACYPINPFELDIPFNKDKALKLLKEWDSVLDSVWDSVQDSVRNSMRASMWDSVLDSMRTSMRDFVLDSVWAFVRDSVAYSVWAPVRDSVRASVRASVQDCARDSAWDSLWFSVWDSVYAYISSLFPNIKEWGYVNHAKGINPFQPGIDLWNMGLVPSFDGRVWRLHKGERAEIVLEITGAETVLEITGTEIVLEITREELRDAKE